MRVTSNIINEGADGVLEQVFTGGGDDLLIVDSTGGRIESLVEIATERRDDAPTIRLLSEAGALKEVMDDFIVGSRAADLIEDGLLEIRAAENLSTNALVVDDQRVIVLVDAGTRHAGLIGDEEEFVTAATEAYEGHWADAEAFSLRTPALSTVRETLEAEIGTEAEADFSAILDSLETARGDGDGLDEVTISLLVAAKNDTLLYDISKWGEDVGIASKATFSRTKTRLEEAGLIDTEKVPIDVGRPRLRLKLGDERLASADDEEFAEIAQAMLA